MGVQVEQLTQIKAQKGALEYLDLVHADLQADHDSIKAERSTLQARLAAAADEKVHTPCCSKRCCDCPCVIVAKHHVA